MFGRAFLEIADRESRHIPDARFSSTPAASRYLADAEVIVVMIAEPTSAAIESMISEEAGTLAARGDDVTIAHSRHGAQPRHAAAKAARVALPSRVAYRLAPRYRESEPSAAMQVAFKAMIASRTVAPLREDAAALE